MKKNLILVCAFFILLITACKPERLPTKTIVEGRILNAKTNQPISGVDVSIGGYNKTIGKLKGFYGSPSNNLIAQVKTAPNGYYRIEFEAKSDSNYWAVTQVFSDFFWGEEENTKSVKPNETQTIDFNFCQALSVLLFYFNDKKLETDSLSFLLIRHKPCASDVIDTIKGTDIPYLQGFADNNSIPDPKPEGNSGVSSYFWVEDNTEVTVKLGRYVKGKAVGFVEKKLKPRIGNTYPQDTVHFVF
jgi:hypothetical protein